MADKRRTILLADDDMDDVEFLREAFQKIEPSLTILKIYSGSEVVDALLSASDTELPGLLILDYNMPDMNGAEVLQKIASVARYDAIVKVVWSTSAVAQYEKISRTHGADHYYIKPDNVGDLETLAGQLLDLIK